MPRALLPRGILVAAECNAEQALAELLRQHLHVHCPGLALRISHVGSHAETITGAIRLAEKTRLPAVIVIADYEEGTYEQYRTQAICSEEDMIEDYRLGRGASILLCGKRIGETIIISIIWRPRSEEVLEAMKGAKLTPSDRKKIKKQKKYTRNVLIESEKAREILESLATRITLILRKHTRR